jgi:hypothetical protein
MPSIFEGSHTGEPLMAEELASLPDAPFWAEHCGWIPGSGHCRGGCHPDCIFRPQRLAEGHRIAEQRRNRRREHGHLEGRAGRR